MEWAGQVARMAEGMSAFKILTGKPTGRRPLGRTILEWTKEIGINTRNWVYSALNRDYWRTLVNAALNFRVSYAMEFVMTYGIGTFSTA